MEIAVIIIMGVSGSGKTTVGERLAEALGWQFEDADRFHPAANVAKMSQGIPLTDADRLPWLQCLQTEIQQWLEVPTPKVLACSALKNSYRQWLQVSDRVKFVYLKGSFELIQQRLSQRQGHFMSASLLKSQFEALEEPDGVFQVDIAQPLDTIVEIIQTTFKN
ncbi:gluconokinase [Alkalinema pantanalense CENA528]|uniref:gluconokinase n=1 Tax=Alkalinema pantanalense TaxID=1620705 RepID=UPI003D6FA769